MPSTTVCASKVHELVRESVSALMSTNIKALIMKLKSVFCAFTTMLLVSRKYRFMTYVPENMTSESSVSPTPSNVSYRPPVPPFESCYSIVTHKTAKHTSMFVNSVTEVFSRIVT